MPDETESPDDELQEQEESVAEDESPEDDDSYEDHLENEDESVREDESHEDMSETLEVDEPEDQSEPVHEEPQQPSFIDPEPPGRERYRPSDPGEGGRNFDDEGYDEHGFDETYDKFKPKG
jgi:hypothetical protein